jgi:hypothetical protein
MGLVLQLVETRADGKTRSVELMELGRPGDLRDIADLGLTLPEAKQLLARVQQAVVAAQARDHAARHRQVVGLMDVFDRAARRPWCSRRDLDAGLLPPHPEGLGVCPAVLIGGHEVPPRTEMAVDHGVG